MSEENAVAAASGSTGAMWALGIAAGLAVGVVVWSLAVGPLKPSAEPGTPSTATAEETEGAEPAAAASGTEETAAVPEATDPAAEPSPDAAPSAATAEATEPEATTETAQAPAADAATDTAEPAAETAAAPPSFDTVRSEPDGSVLVAGQTEPGKTVMVMSDGAEVGRATADASGNFVAFLDMGTSAAPRVLTLMADGGQASSQTVILAPSPQPTVVASALPMQPAGAGAATADEPVAEAAAPATGETAPAASADADAAATETAPAPAAEPLIVTDEGVKKLAPAPAEGIVIDTISYGALGQVQIEGRGQGGSFARLYLDNAAIVTAPIGAKGNWGAVLTDVAAGIYTLRVDQLDESGSVTSRFETPFQREAPEAVAAATATQAPAAEAPEPAAPETTAAEPAATEPPATETAVATAEPAAEAAPSAEPAAVAAATDADPAPPKVTRAAVVTVQPGFTLWQIATENYGDGMLYVKVFEANKDQIRDPDLIYPGQIFAVPEDAN